jgi:hypothetical protein
VHHTECMVLGTESPVGMPVADSCGAGWIETATGLDFLWELDDATEVNLESKPAPATW